MKRVLVLALLMVASALVFSLQPKTRMTRVVASQERYKSKYPSYCCTPAGKLGPYRNNTSVEEGGACYGTDNKGQRQEGTACYGKADEKAQGESSPQKYKSKYPSYCCTPAGKLGPYRNNTSVEEGGACYGTDSKGQRQEGTACYGEADERAQGESKGKSAYPQYIDLTNDWNVARV
jgi:hypothetical protein